MADLVHQSSAVFTASEPDEVLLQYRSEVHSDHRMAFDAGVTCMKRFRHRSGQRVLSYETISETGSGLGPDSSFRPTSCIGISEFLEKKLELVSVYQAELCEFPFPRSLEAVRALASFRGASSGFVAAEAFQLLRERS